jgi:hypothetical protein
VVTRSDGRRFWMQEEKEGEPRLVPVGVLCLGQRSFAPCSLLRKLCLSELCLCVQIHTHLNTPPLLIRVELHEIGERRAELSSAQVR